MSVSSLISILPDQGYALAAVWLIFTLATYHYYKNVYSYFTKQGIKGPTPLPLIGNLLPLLVGTDRLRVERDWLDKYGKFYGIFRGMRRTYIVNDAELMRQLSIRDFHVASNHGAIFPQVEGYQADFILFTSDDHWRRLRALHTSSFTSGKIKRMFRLLDRCADDLIEDFSAKLANGNKSLKRAIVNLKDIYSMYTIDSITTAAYSIKLDRKLEGEGKTKGQASFLALAKEAIRFDIPRILVGLVVPIRILKACGFEMVPTRCYNEIGERLLPIIKQRRNASGKFDDCLQNLVDARVDDQVNLDDLDEKENHHASLSQNDMRATQADMIKRIRRSDESKLNSTEARLTDNEIISSAIFLLLVGLETTATLLINCTYALAFHPEVQQRLYEIIKSLARVDRDTKKFAFDYDELTSCEYLDAVISETLRSSSPILQTDRVVRKDYYVEKYDVFVKAGDSIYLNLYGIMNNPEYWPNPLKFDPERFMGENKKKIVPGSYCPFGLGPRHCLGMRFSLTEAKLALAKVLMRFEFTPAPGTKFPSENGRIFVFNTYKNPSVEVKQR